MDYRWNKTGGGIVQLLKNLGVKNLVSPDLYRLTLFLSLNNSECVLATSDHYVPINTLPFALSISLLLLSSGCLICDHRSSFPQNMYNMNNICNNDACSSTQCVLHGGERWPYLGVFQVEEVAPWGLQGLDGKLIGTQEKCRLHHV